MRAPSEACENGFASLDRVFRAARINRDVLGGGLCAGSADRAVQHRYAAGSTAIAERKFHLERQRARLDNDSVCGAALDEAALAEKDRLDRSDARQRRDHNLRGASDSADRRLR